MKPLRTMCAFALTATLCSGWAAPGPAAAQAPEKRLYLGAAAGANAVLDDWDLYDGVDYPVAPDSGMLVTLRSGLDVLSWLGFELQLGIIPFTHDTGDTNLALSYAAAMVLHPFDGRWSPHLEGGWGLYHNVAGDRGTDVDSQYHYGLGLRVGLAEDLMLRVEVRHLMTDAVYKPRLAHNIEATVGVDFVAWRELPDADDDGWADAEDACPNLAGPASAGGCPDADGDGLADRDDACPEVAGEAALKGCPDGDQDGVADGSDACPHVSGPAALGGCPDTDADGVSDAKDRCPLAAGDGASDGCPAVADGGLPPPETEAAQLAVEPTRATPPPLPPPRTNEAELAVTTSDVPPLGEVRFDPVRFRNNSGRILPKHRPRLDAYAAVLVRYRSIRLRLEGYASSSGGRGSNQNLSDKRARRVRRYLMNRGVEGRRIEAYGYGEERSLADNDTATGRAANRAVVFVMLGESGGVAASE